MSIRAQFPIVVDYGRDIESMLREDKYLTFISGIILCQVQTSIRGVKNINIDIFFTQSVSTQPGVLWMMNAHMRRPVEVIELLAFGHQHPDIPLIMPVIAFGSIIELGNTKYIFGLTVDEGERVLRLFPLSMEWPPEYGFAATHK